MIELVDFSIASMCASVWINIELLVMNDCEKWEVDLEKQRSFNSDFVKSIFVCAFSSCIADLGKTSCVVYAMQHMCFGASCVCTVNPYNMIGNSCIALSGKWITSLIYL